MKKIVFLFFLICFSTYSQDKWQLIDGYDLKFKLPIGYNFKETPKAKTYSYQDDDKIISLSIFKNDAVKNLETSNRDELKRYYKGIIDGYIDKSGNEVLSRETYKIEDRLADKNILKIVYQDGSSNLLETHILFLNGLNYFATFQFEENPNEQTVNAKNIFFDSFGFKASIDTTTKEKEVKTPINNNSYELGKTIGEITLYTALVLVIGIIIYLFFKKKKSTV